MILSDEGPTLETLDFIIRISSTPTSFYISIMFRFKLENRLISLYESPNANYSQYLIALFVL